MWQAILMPFLIMAFAFVAIGAFPSKHEHDKRQQQVCQAILLLLFGVPTVLIVAIVLPHFGLTLIGFGLLWLMMSGKRLGDWFGRN
jgi:hypothetical protein